MRNEVIVEHIVKARSSAKKTYKRFLFENHFTQQLSKNNVTIMPIIQKKRQKFLESRLDLLYRSKIQK